MPAEQDRLREQLRIGIDIGGTFTDFVSISSSSGRIAVHKTLTTDEDPSRGAMQGFATLLDELDISGSDVQRVVHATTLAANVITQRAGSRTAVLTTRGFADILEIGTERRYDGFTLQLDLPAPLVPRPNRLEIDERTLADGVVQLAPNKAQVLETISALVNRNVEAVAICFLHSYRNPSNEQLVASWIRQDFPTLAVSLSSEVAPEIGEYQRTSTTTADAFVKRRLENYIRRMESGLRGLEYGSPLYLLSSSAGALLPQMVRDSPIRLLESGPAAGVLAASYFGSLSGEGHIVAFDMGGTTAKICLVDNGKPALVGELEVARVSRFKPGSGLPMRIPSLSLLEIGAGGGSIGHLDEAGLLKVGPVSAESDPGPACYGLGGTEPTVTDANLLLGYLDPDFFLGGKMRLDIEAAERAIHDRIANPLGMSAVRAADGIRRVVNENMAAALKMHCAEKGRDRRRYTLLATGGAGPMHACLLARSVGMKKVIVPPWSGVLSAFGMLTAPIALDFVRSYVTDLSEVDWGYLNALYTQMEDLGKVMLLEAGVDEGEIRISRSADMCYSGQDFQVNVPIPSGTLNAHDIERITAAFQYEYEQKNMSALDFKGKEVIFWRTRVAGPSPVIQIAVQTPNGAGETDAVKRIRKAYFHSLGAFVDCPVYDRYLLRPGAELMGPAIVEERESTTIVEPDCRVSVDDFLNLIIHLNG